MNRTKFILIISILFAYLFFTSYADEYGTDVEFIGTGIEAYNVTVPAMIKPNGSGNVIVEGEWASNRVVNVTADNSVEIVNEDNVFDKRKIDINFLGISAKGNNSASQIVDEKILVGDIYSDILFGKWKGTFNYNVEIVDNVNNELYYGRLYTKTFEHEVVPREVPLYFIPNEDKSATFIFEDGEVTHSSPNTAVIENGYIYFDGLTFTISENKTKLNLIDPATTTVLGTWELEIPNDVLDNNFPIIAKKGEVNSNTSAYQGETGVKRISSISLTPLQLLKLKFKTISNGVEIEWPIKYHECLNNSICLVLYGHTALISTKVAMYSEEMGVFFKQPGIYVLDVFDEVDVELSFYDSYEENNLIWNSLDVKGNKTVQYNDHELVKISDNVKDSEYFSNAVMYVTIDGMVMEFYKLSIDGDKIFKVSYDTNYKYIIVVNEPGEYDGVTFDEVGIYAYNYGKYNKNYNIIVGYDYAPEFTNNLQYFVPYNYGDLTFTFDSNGTADMSGSQVSYTTNGRMINVNDGLIATVSSDGKNIKFHKYLSDKWFDEETDDVTFEY